MSEHIRTDAMRRHVAAIHTSMSGPGLSEFLDPRRVLVGAGSGIPERERPQFAHGLAEKQRCMIYFEFAPGADVARPTRINVVEPTGGGRVSWFDECFLWTAGRTSEIVLVPTPPASRGRYVSRGGGLRFMPGRPSDIEAGQVLAQARLEHTVLALSPDDYSGQNRVEESNGLVGWWQHYGYAIRP